jgi:hypothetical protein
MDTAFDDILRKQELDREEIKVLLAAEGEQMKRLLRRGLMPENRQKSGS